MKRKPANLVPKTHQHGQNNRALRQLPDVGANHKPTSLRKDLWRPLYTLHLPATASGTAQGLHAYKRLQEHRKLHEIAWKPSPLLSRPYSSERIDELKKWLENRGGSKNESVYDVVKKLKKKLRVKEILDQKAKSVADLAEVLAEQESRGLQLGNDRVAERERDEARVQEEMRGLLRKLEEGGSEWVEGLRQALVNFEANFNAKRDKGNMGERQMAHQQERVKGLRRQIKRVEWLQSLNLGQTADAAWEKEVVDLQAQREKDAQEAQANKQRKVEARAGPAEIEKAEKSAQEARERMEKLTPSRPKNYHAKFLPAEWPKELQYSGPAVIPKRGFWHNKFKNAQKEAWALEGTTVHWANPLDAEYAEQWPEAVVHDRLVYSRHVAPTFEPTEAEEVVENTEAAVEEAVEQASPDPEVQKHAALSAQEPIGLSAEDSARTVEHYHTRLQKAADWEERSQAAARSAAEGSQEKAAARQNVQKAQEQTAWVQRKMQLHEQVQERIKATWQEFVAQEAESVPSLAQRLKSKEQARYAYSLARKTPVVRAAIEKGKEGLLVRDAADGGSQMAGKEEVRSAEEADARI